MCQDQGRAYSWLQRLISLSPHCSLGRTFHWLSADIPLLPHRELSFCSASLTTNYSTPNFTLEKVHCSVDAVPPSHEEHCRLAPTKMGDRKKRIKAVLALDTKVYCQMLKLLMFELGFLERGSWSEVTPAELQRSRVTGESECSLLHQVIFRSIHGTYCGSYSQSPLLP